MPELLVPTFAWRGVGSLLLVALGALEALEALGGMVALMLEIC